MGTKLDSSYSLDIVSIFEPLNQWFKSLQSISLLKKIQIFTLKNNIADMNDQEIYDNILTIVKEFGSDSKGITKTEVTRRYTENFGTSNTTIWDYILDLIDSGKLEFKKVGKIQHRLFYPDVNL